MVCLFFCGRALAGFFGGVSYANFESKYCYSALNFNQYLGTFSGVNVNQYVDFEFPKASSFGSKSGFGSHGASVNFGYEFKRGKFFYTPELFANYDPTKVTDLTIVPAQNFTGTVIVRPFLPPINQVIDIPAQIQAITYKMPYNIGMISRTGYYFKPGFSASFITGGTLTIFDVIDTYNKERIYKGRFLAGFGLEWEIEGSSNLKVFADYKYYIPLTKDILRQYPDPENPGKLTTVLIKGFKASSQTLDFGVKYYF